MWTGRQAVVEGYRLIYTSWGPSTSAEIGRRDLKSHRAGTVGAETSHKRRSFLCICRVRGRHLQEEQRRSKKRTGEHGLGILCCPPQERTRRDNSSTRDLHSRLVSNGHTSTPLGPLRRPPVPKQLNRGRRKKRRERNGKQRPRRPNKRAGQKSKRGATEMASARVGVLSVRVRCDAADRAFMLIARTTLDAATREAFRTASIWMPIRVERAVRRRP